MTEAIYEKTDIKGEGKYSPMVLNSYDKIRHIPTEDASLLIGQQKSLLEVGKLEEAVKSKDIKKYNFRGKEYFDRLDLGRVYHQEKKEKEGLTVERYFTEEGKDPFSSVEYKRKDLVINDFNTCQKIFELKNAEIPIWMDDTSAQIVAQKYFFNPDKEEWKEKLKSKIGLDHENSVKHLNKRVTDFFTDEGWKLGYFKTEEDREIFRDELNYLQANGIAAFNSPTQFNAGIYNTYEIEGSSGINYYKDPETGEVKRVQNGEYVHPQLHACFIRGPRDDLESLAQQVVDEIGIFSSGSGNGHNASVIRANGEKLSGGGKASGLISFEVIYDKTAGSIKSGGKTRRAARMLVNDYNHPEIMEFIRFKVNEDKKAKTLMEAGFSGGMDGEAYNTVAFQNTNLSVRLNDDFFDSLNKGGKIELYNVNDGKPAGKVSADRMLKEISFGSWRIGDPAVQYDGMIQEMHTAKNSGMQKSTNPCGEYAFNNDTSCSLFSSRLTAFMKEDGSFDVESFKKTNKIFTIAQNIANKAASYPVKEIAMISPEFATIGGGYADLGSYLMRKGIPYDSEKGRAITGAITALMTGSVYETSSEIAEKVEPFVHFEFNREPMIEVMKKHKKNLDNILWEEVGDKNLKDSAYSSWENVVNKGESKGFANAQATVIAPTGTISYLMGCSTTGIEPAMSLSITKNLAGGGNVTIANKDVKIALEKLGYSELQIKDISNHVGKRNTMVDAPHVNPSHYAIFDTAFGNAKGEGSIDIDGHLKIMSAAQPFVSGAISKTINLPSSATVKDVYDCYVEGYKLGLKGITVFRNDSKPISALSFGGKENKKLIRGEKEDLKPRRNAKEWEVEINGTPLHIITGEYDDGRPGQITFLSYKAGSTMKALLETHGIQASKALKRGVHLDDVLSGWEGQSFEPNGLVYGHEYIKTASSPLDFAAKLMRLEYLGDKEIANDPTSVNPRNLRGAENGAFRAYAREKIDEWNVDHVLSDSETGGFVEKSGDELILEEMNGKKNKKNNERGVLCSCGSIMKQTGPSCYECTNCSEKRGGCGA